MNIQVFLFKLIAILTYILRVGLLVLPVALVIVISKEGGWKYGFTFIQNNISVALFVSFAIGFLVALYHALSFEVVGNCPQENYLRSHQKVNVKGNASLETVKAKLEEDKRNKDFKLNDNVLSFKRGAIFIKPDQIKVTQNSDTFLVESKPFARFWFIDFARNFKNVTLLAKLLKQ
jgi:hypothetical protein